MIKGRLHTSEAKQCVEGVGHVAWSIGKPSRVRVLEVEART